jgi:beta-glucanase (GH16 family)
MMPEDSTYGAWPRSGEIDIMESRGNTRDYPDGGRNLYYGTLHWGMPKSFFFSFFFLCVCVYVFCMTNLRKGPSASTDAYYRTTGAKKLRRGDYSESFHTYGMEWTENYIYFYLDNRIMQISFIGFDKKEPLWDKGEFAKMAENSSLLVNPWAGSSSTTGNAPFDQKFYLILNVAVGSRNGWFL